jgi:hypothetical protein
MAQDTPRQVKDQQAVRITLRLPEDLYAALQARAQEEERTVNGQIIWYIRRGLNPAASGDRRTREE